MKYVANHTLVIGEGAAAKTLQAGDSLPKLTEDEIQRLKRLEAVTAAEDEPVEQADADKKPAGGKAAGAIKG